MTGRAKRAKGVVGLLLASMVSVASSSCGGGRTAIPPGQNFAESQSNRFVIRETALPTGYTRVDSRSGSRACDSTSLVNYGARTETSGEAAAKERLLALGARGCHVSVYEKAADNTTTGLRVLAVVFPTPEAASQSLALLRASFSDPLLTESWAEGGEIPPPAEDLPSEGLGDESTPGIKRVVVGHEAVGLLATTIDVIWRVHNVAVVLSLGNVRDMVERDVLQLGKDMSARAVQ